MRRRDREGRVSQCRCRPSPRLIGRKQERKMYDCVKMGIAELTGGGEYAGVL